MLEWFWCGVLLLAAVGLLWVAADLWIEAESLCVLLGPLGLASGYGALALIWPVSGAPITAWLHAAVPQQGQVIHDVTVQVFQLVLLALWGIGLCVLSALVRRAFKARQPEGLEGDTEFSADGVLPANERPVG